MFFSKLPLLFASSFLSVAAVRDVPASTSADTEVAGSRDSGKPARKGADGLCEQIACTDAQRTALGEIRSETREKLRESRREIMAGAVAEMHDVLDAAQRAKLAAMIEKHGAKAALGRGHGKGGSKPDKLRGKDKPEKLKAEDKPEKVKAEGKGKNKKDKDKPKSKPDRDLQSAKR